MALLVPRLRAAERSDAGGTLEHGFTGLSLWLSHFLEPCLVVGIFQERAFLHIFEVKLLDIELIEFLGLEPGAMIGAAELHSLAFFLLLAIGVHGAIGPIGGRAFQHVR